jgi:hypothetical protein
MVGFSDVKGMSVPGAFFDRLGKLTATGWLALELNGSMDIANCGSYVEFGTIGSGKRS